MPAGPIREESAHGRSSPSRRPRAQTPRPLPRRVDLGPDRRRRGSGDLVEVGRKSRPRAHRRAGGSRPCYDPAPGSWFRLSAGIGSESAGRCAGRTRPVAPSEPGRPPLVRPGTGSCGTAARAAPPALPDRCAGRTRAVAPTEPAARAKRTQSPRQTNPIPAPTEPNPRADRTRDLAPTEPEPPHRADTRPGAERTRACRFGAARCGFARLGDRSGPGSAPREANPRRRTNPILGAERTRASPPSGPEPRRRANPSVQVSSASVRLRAARGPIRASARRRADPRSRRRANPGVRVSSGAVRPRADRGGGQRSDLSKSILHHREFGPPSSLIPAGARRRAPHTGTAGLKPTLDPRRDGLGC